MKAEGTLANYRSYLEGVAADIENPAAGFFGPKSAIWRVNREGVLAFGAFRAVLLQIAHPMVAMGVAHHSAFPYQSLERISRTFQAQQQIIFGSCDEAIQALVRIKKHHLRVEGEFAWQGGRRRYSASDPALLMWVYGTLVDTIIRSYGMFLKPLPFRERENLYQDSKLFGRLMGIPGEMLPETLADFTDWISEILASDALQVSPEAREIAGALLRLPAPIFWPVNYILAVGMLPERLRADYGFHWNPTFSFLFELGVGMVRQTALRMPLRMRTFRGYWTALGRIGEVGGY